MIYFDFIKRRFWFYALAALVFVGGPLLIAARGLNLGLDFVGGTEFLVRFDNPTDEDGVRKVLGSGEFAALGDLQVYRVHSGSGTLLNIRTKLSPEAIKAYEAKVMKALGTLGAMKHLSTNSIGPVVGDSLKKNTAKAIFWSCVVIFAYMWFRFEVRPGVVTALALAHDTLAVVALFAITQGEIDITVIAAILTVLGYSMNDSIVILDRIRENVRAHRTMPHEELVNLAANQCLGRTLFTGITVMLTLVTLLAMGPPVLHNFALAMLVGILSGTLSTVTVVCPLLVDWENYAPTRKVKRDS